MEAKKIYVVDDDPVFTELMTAILEAAGYSVSSHHAAAYAISEIKKQRPHCTLIDLQMSEMDGLELCRALRKVPQLEKMKIIMVSAHSDEIWRDRALAAGAEGYIEKPIDTDGFLRSIENTLSGGAAN